MKGTSPKAIILITTDEQRFDTLSAYGCEAVDTPNIDRIGEQGARFDNAYTASPWCLPSRCSILTGCYPHRHGAYSNFRKVPLDPGIPNLYSSAKKAGYKTTHFGKCHYEPVRYGTFSPDATDECPETREYYLSLGIDHLALQDDKNVSIWQYDDYSRELDGAGFLDAYRAEAWNRKDGGVFKFPGPKEWHPDHWVGRKAARYIDAWKGEENLFAWISFSGPHYPIDPPDQYLDRVRMDKLPPIESREGEWEDNGRIHYTSFNGKGGIDGCGYNEENACSAYDESYWTKMRQYYMANVALIDDQVGLIMESLERKFGDDVLVIFTSDHGDMLGNHGLWGKNNCGYDEVLKVPFLVKGLEDKGIKGIFTERIQTIDILPTISEMMGSESLQVDGSSLQKIVAKGGYEYTLAEGEGFYCIGDGRFRLIQATVKQSEKTVREFLDLENDPHGYVNLIEDPDSAKDISRLQNALLEIYTQQLLP